MRMVKKLNGSRFSSKFKKRTTISDTNVQTLKKFNLILQAHSKENQDLKNT